MGSNNFDGPVLLDQIDTYLGFGRNFGSDPENVGVALDRIAAVVGPIP
jgi:hypothetical protein